MSRVRYNLGIVKYLHRRLWNTLTALSLLLCLSTLALWMRSYRHEDRWFGRRSQVEGGTFTEIADRWLESVRGELHLIRDITTFDRTRPAPPETVRGFAALGFAVLTRNGGATSPRGNQSINHESTLISVPHWFLAAAFLGVALPGLRRARRDRIQIRAGLCPTCGYDLRASPERCPECGTVPEKPKRISN
jgi:hypothetical protein